MKGWARIDPDNAVPWLLAAAQARESKDTAAEAAAFSQASKAQKSESYNYSLLEYSAPEMPADATSLERWNLAIEMIGIEAAVAQPYGHAASMHCSKQAVQDKTVAQQCQALAELWVSRPGTILDLMLDIAIGARAGWSPQRVDALTQQANAYKQALTEATPSKRDDQWTCKGVEQGNAYVAKMTRMGEIGAIRDLLEHSAETIAELSRKHVEAMERLFREAQQQIQAAPSL